MYVIGKEHQDDYLAGRKFSSTISVVRHSRCPGVVPFPAGFIFTDR
jgi:hypothetical protein